ncbi:MULTISPECIES: hypothetical protein [unclassified Mycolicibacterium]|uniref:hypothetical protein n=1 Tax=unclassified Mycolicibacterium TaxID=2636767 RepID=UPI0012DBF4B8|nr:MULTISPECIES: hypothetical protein [unclassified Mycolicibacterium]MUL82468.1 hypothetical protein [Mycolicibacterium sp. CBMA 329]MUL91400.1 hypothetical protein [Mycolicibacterium sp. CBMA 331]MUM01523.1 hypothetical protein [Mycolicibacterium sp. CBMA 334]MUM29403.1 hypothetical protein [Mycolicibacterium sp. CBMA 295]MUM41824.1 hypothetical protein [Mycolicibacterium sp. CBMA 247]
MSEPVGQQLLTYTARVAAIRAILAKHLTVDGLVQNNRLANPIHPSDCLSASWGADAVAASTLTLAIHPVADFTAEVEELRYGAGLTPGQADLRAANATAYEVRRDEPDEFALVQVHLSSVWVVVGHCEVYLAHRDISPEKLIEAAVEIARSIGCAPYTDDYEPPSLPPGWSPSTYG